MQAIAPAIARPTASGRGSSRRSAFTTGIEDEGEQHRDRHRDQHLAPERERQDRHGSEEGEGNGARQPPVAIVAEDGQPHAGVLGRERVGQKAKSTADMSAPARRSFGRHPPFVARTNTPIGLDGSRRAFCRLEIMI
jgi:hypothetical protein